MSDEMAGTEAVVPSEYGPRAEFITLAGIAAALGTSTTLGLKAYELLNPKEPFIAHVVDSYSEKDKYVVELRVQNLDVHTLYVESIKLEEPLELTVVEKPNNSMSFGESRLPIIPCRLKSGQSEELRLILKPPEKSEYGTAKVEIARLGEKSRETKKVRFLIRGS
ncbi:MAG: hypothetical protein QOF89_6225 [Acidobacteriota bacterium]|jgi:hypothetical protein|nr:hypothetical protein [Acidobacteriota bacterium]